MANNIFSTDVDYVKRFVDNQSKKIKMPNFTYLDAKLHPKYKDHIVVLSKNEFPEGVNMTFSYAQPIYDISYLHSDINMQPHFEAALDAYKAVSQEEKKKAEAAKTTKNLK